MDRSTRRFSVHRGLPGAWSLFVVASATLASACAGDGATSNTTDTDAGSASTDDGSPGDDSGGSASNDASSTIDSANLFNDAPSSGGDSAVASYDAGGVDDTGAAPPDGGGVPDAGVSGDAGAYDAGGVDSGTVDAGKADAGKADAGGVDAGAVDSGQTDAGGLDSGPLDAGTPMLKVQYMDGNGPGTDSSNNIKPYFRIVNLSAQAAPLSEITVRYWFLSQGVTDFMANCDYSNIPGGCGTATFVKMATPVAAADYYVQIAYDVGAGSIGAGGTSGDDKLRFEQSTYATTFNQPSDYSYNGALQSFADWNKMTLYVNGKLVWGVEP